MSDALVEALSGVEDDDTVKEILDAFGVETESTTSTQPNQPTLSDLYDRFLRRRQQRSSATRSQYKRTIPVFVTFAETHNVDHPGQITTGLVDEFVDGLEASFSADATIYTYTKNVRTWLNWLNDRQLCDEAVYNILSKDELGLSPKARDEALPADEATAILENLRARRYGTPIHTTTELFWNGGLRLGDAHSLDLCDFYPEENELWIAHRPDTGTRLKNGSEDDDTPGDGERYIELRDEAVEAIEHFVKYERPDVADEHGREPLFATEYGRACKSTLRRWLYRATSCRWQPDGREKRDCDGDCDSDSKICPQSYYPHAIRRGAIVDHLSGGLRQDLASQRFDVSVAVIKKHYDPRTKHQRKEDRAEAVRQCWRD